MVPLAIQAGHILFLSLSFRWTSRLQIIRQPIKRAFPKLSIFLDPLRGLLERLGVQLHFMDAAIAATSKQSRFLENPEVF